MQADAYNRSQRFVIVAEISTHPANAADPANLLIEIATPDGQATSLIQDSIVTCLQLATISEDRLQSLIGKLSPTLLLRLNDCLKAALEIP